eukprot:7484815-Pyramimonas_sp.AAC.1
MISTRTTIDHSSIGIQGGRCNGDDEMIDVRANLTRDRASQSTTSSVELLEAAGCPAWEEAQGESRRKARRSHCPQ